MSSFDSIREQENSTPGRIYASELEFSCSILHLETLQRVVLSMGCCLSKEPATDETKLNDINTNNLQIDPSAAEGIEPTPPPNVSEQKDIRVYIALYDYDARTDEACRFRKATIWRWKRTIVNMTGGWLRLLKAGKKATFPITTLLK